MSLRVRLFIALGVVSVAPILVLTFTIANRAQQRAEAQAHERLTGALDAVRDRIARRRVEAERTLDRLANEVLPALSASASPASSPAASSAARPSSGLSIDPGLARTLASGTDLDALEILDADGRVLSSLHWPAGFGLSDGDLVLSTEPPLRLETVAAGRGATHELSVTPETRAALAGRPLTLRGGYFLDAGFFGDFQALLRVETGCWDESRASWYTRNASPLEAWTPPPFSARSGQASLPDGDSSTLWSWVSLPLAQGVELVAAAPRHDLVSQQEELMSLTRSVTLGALAAAFLCAWFLSSRLSRPLRDLSEGVERIAAGDWHQPLSTPRADEFGDLGRAFDDMTASLRLSRVRLQRTERVAAWREMARRLAHELKNPLFPIQISIETTTRALEREADQIPPDVLKLVRESSATTLEELAALRKIVDEFGAFARMPPPAPQLLDIPALLERVVALHRTRAPELEIRLDIPQDLPSVRADADQIARALGNLIANAIEAMPDGGKLTLSVRGDAHELLIDIADTGTGIPEHAREQLFTPYYTTKRSGTGLGLPIVQAIATDHGGHIDVHTTSQAGTTFRLVLPVGGPSDDDPARVVPP